MKNLFNNLFDLLLYLIMIILIVVVGFFTFSKLLPKNDMVVSALQLPVEKTITLSERMALYEKETSMVLDNNFGLRVKFTNLTGGNNSALINTNPYSFLKPYEHFYGVFKYIGEGDEQDLSNVGLRIYNISVVREGSRKYSNRTIYLNSVAYWSDIIVDFTPNLMYEPSVFDNLTNLNEIEFYVNVTPYSYVDYIIENYTFEYYISEYDFAGIVNYNYQMGYNKGYEAGLNAGSNADVEEAYQEGYQAGYNAGVNYASGVYYNQGYNFGYVNGYNDGYQSGLSSGNLISYEQGYQAGYAEGLSDGYSDGYNAGKSDGYDAGYNAGESDGYDSGYNAGKSDGYDAGYNAGFSEGTKENGGTGWFVSILAGISTILSIEFLPGFTFGTILFVPIIFGLFWWFIKMIKGGNE